VPLLFQADHSIYIASGGAQLPIDLDQFCQPVGREVRRGSEGQHLECTEDGAAFPHLRRVQPADTEPAAQICIQDAFAREPKESLPDGSSADAELAGKRRISHPGSRGQFTSVNPLENFSVCLIAERLTVDQFSSSV
jgi:hypothetical protein